MDKNCKIESVEAVDGGVVLLYRHCNLDEVSWVVKTALQSEGFSLCDGTDKHGIYKLSGKTLLSKFMSGSISFKLDIVLDGDTVLARIEDVTPELAHASPKGVHLRNLRKIIAYLRFLDKENI